MAKIVISNGVIHSDEDFNLTSGDNASTRACFRICKQKDSHTKLRSLSSYRIKSSTFLNTGDAEVCGNLTVHGTCTTLNTTITATTTATTDNFVIQSTDSGGTGAPDFKLYRNSASAINGDNIGEIQFVGRNAANTADIQYAGIRGEIRSTANGSECGAVYFSSKDGVDRAFISEIGMTVFQNYYISGTGSLRNYGGCLNLTTGGGAYDITFQPNSVEKMRLTSGGNLGIGTDAPSEKLHIVTDETNFGGIIIDNSNAGTHAIAGMTLINNLNDQFFMLMHSSTRTTAPRYGIALGSWSEILAQDAPNGLLVGTGTSSTPIVFGTNNNERMRILSDGNVGIGTTAPGSKLEISGDICGTTCVQSSVLRATSTATIGSTTPATETLMVCGNSRFVRGGSPVSIYMGATCGSVDVGLVWASGQDFQIKTYSGGWNQALRVLGTNTYACGCLQSPIVCATSCVSTPSYVCGAYIRASNWVWAGSYMQSNILYSRSQATSLCLITGNTANNAWSINMKFSPGDVPVAYAYGSLCGAVCVKSPIVCATSCIQADAADLMIGNNAINLASQYATQKGFSVDASTGRTDAVGNNTTALQLGRINGAGQIQVWRCASVTEGWFCSTGQLWSCGCLCSPLVCATTCLQTPTVKSSCILNEGGTAVMRFASGFAQACTCLSTPIVCATSYIRSAGDICAATGGTGRQLQICDSGTGATLKADAGNSRAYLLLDEDSSDGVGAGSDYAFLVRTGGNTTLDNGGGGKVLISTAGVVRLCSDSSLTCAAVQIQSPLVCATTCLRVDGSQAVCLTHANPRIKSGSSYIIMPNGLYIEGGTLYAQNNMKARGGICNDTGTPLTLFGGNNAERCTVLCGKTFSCTCLHSPTLCATTWLRTGTVKANILEQNSGASNLCIRTEGGTNRDIVISPNGTGTTCIQGNLCVTTCVHATTVCSNENYISGWFRNNSCGAGLYNSYTSQHWYSDDDDWWNVAGGTTCNGIRFRDEHNGNIRGSIWANNSNQISLSDMNNAVRVLVNSSSDIRLCNHTCVYGNLYVSGMVCTEGIEGDTFNSASCKLNSITCFNTSCVTGCDAIYDIYVSANPNCGGSGAYRDVVHMTSYVTTGWNGSAVTKYINTVEHFNRGDAHSSGSGPVTASVHLVVGAIGCECYSSTSNTCLQVRICGGNTGTNAANRTSECVLIKRIL